MVRATAQPEILQLEDPGRMRTRYSGLILRRVPAHLSALSYSSVSVGHTRSRLEAEQRIPVFLGIAWLPHQDAGR